MTLPGESQKKIDGYLGKLRGRLRGLSGEEVRDIVEELRSHIMDKATENANEEENGEITPAGVNSALAALGSPEELASQYVTDNFLARAEVSRSPLQIVKGLFRVASLSTTGFFVLFGSIVGYCFGIVLILVAVAKLFHPHAAGVWMIPTGGGDFETSFRLGFGSAPAGGRDLLGWWIVPIGWITGCGLVTLTTKVAVWFVRQCRRSLTLP